MIVPNVVTRPPTLQPAQQFHHTPKRITDWIMLERRETTALAPRDPRTVREISARWQAAA